ncbi:MAG: oligosaccharide flippase family protein [bacterium]|nr:oligosaccharide flippase family protein [bacterium]
MKTVIFIKNALILTVTSLILRGFGIILKIWLAAKVGPEGIGLYQLIFSFYVLASAFSTAGISTAVTRLVSNEIHKGLSAIKHVLLKAVLLTLLIAIISCLLVFFGADFIASCFLKDSRATVPLRILSLSLPFMGVSSCFKGYFIARRKALPPSFAQIVEQVVRIAIIVVLIESFAHRGIVFCTGAILVGDTVAEIFSCLHLWLMYNTSKRTIKSGSQLPIHVFKKLIHIAAPITAGRYVITGLHTVENIIIPSKLALLHSAGYGLSLFGKLKGMALPLIFFPSSFLTSISTMLIPEISEAAALSHKQTIQSETQRTVNITFVLSILIGSIFLINGRLLGQIIYKDNDVGLIIQILAPIIPFMYLESVADGILKGLNQQKHSFLYSVVDSIIRIVLIYLFVPRFGLYGFLGIMILSNTLSSCLNLFRLIKISHIKPDISNNLIKPIFAALLGGTGEFALGKLVVFSPFVTIVLKIIIHTGIFFAVLYLLNGLSVLKVEEFKSFKLHKKSGLR